MAACVQTDWQRWELPFHDAYLALLRLLLLLLLFRLTRPPPLHRNHHLCRRRLLLRLLHCLMEARTRLLPPLHLLSLPTSSLSYAAHSRLLRLYHPVRADKTR